MFARGCPSGEDRFDVRPIRPNMCQRNGSAVYDIRVFSTTSLQTDDIR